MNNIFLNNNDPLLYNRSSTQYQDPNDIYNQVYRNKLFNDMYQGTSNDMIGDLDNILKDLDENVSQDLQKDLEWITLNNSLQSAIQSEIINLVKYRLNINPNIVDNINKQKEIIKNHQQTIKDRERKNIQELNDYMKNYSNMSFDEYKKIKEDKS